MKAGSEELDRPWNARELLEIGGVMCYPRVLFLDLFCCWSKIFFKSSYNYGVCGILSPLELSFPSDSKKLN